jgi:hypothetical protein
MPDETSIEKINVMAFSLATDKLIENNFDEFVVYYKMFLKEKIRESKFDRICAVE